MKKYIAIKVVGLKHWLWFETDKTTEENGKFIGKEGWGNGGAYTEIEIDSQYITGRIRSNELQYV